jgi:hypothetical protein
MLTRDNILEESKMKTVSWKIKDGREAIVTISIDKNEQSVDNGWGGEIESIDPASDWKIRYSAKVAGEGEVNGLNCPISDECPAGYAGQLGKLGFKADIRLQIEAAIAAVKSSDDWQQHLAAEKEEMENSRKYYAGKRQIERAMRE